MPEKTCYKGFRRGTVIVLFEDPCDGYRWGEVVARVGKGKISYVRSYSRIEEDVLSGWEKHHYVSEELSRRNLASGHIDYAAVYDQFVD